LKKNEVCLISPNFKPTFKQTKNQKLKRNTLLYYAKIFLKPETFEKENKKKKTENT